MKVETKQFFFDNYNKCMEIVNEFSNRLNERYKSANGQVVSIVHNEFNPKVEPVAQTTSGMAKIIEGNHISIAGVECVVVSCNENRIDIVPLDFEKKLETRKGETIIMYVYQNAN